ncbi:MAG: ATP-binding protein [Planctomycetota bacterium]|jgi:anti-sigma regulatory factor (Ser/Thr protein kinase)
MALTRPLREFLSLTLEAQGFEEEEIDEIRLVATEMVNNSFEHASDRPLHEVEIRMLVDAEKWEFRIRDEGEGRITQEDFDFEGKGPPDHLGDRGRGNFLITCFSDAVEVHEVEGGGTEVKVTKYRKGGA